MDKLSKKEENEMYKDKCNQMITNQEIPKITKDEYKILEFNEFGGQRNVFRGKYKGHDVAIKINKDLDYKLLAHELFIISELQHENIEKLYGVCLDDNEITIVTEYIDGTTLDVMNKSEDFTEQDRISAIKDICAGIACIHNNDLGIIHRDLKPNNIMVDKNNKCIIIDFGIAKVCSNKNDTKTLTRGTVEYTSPDEYNDESITKKVDIWALGCIIYNLFTGYIPWTESTEFEGFEPWINKCLCNDSIPFVISNKITNPIIRNLIERCTVRDHTKRADINEVLDILKEL